MSNRRPARVEARVIKAVEPQKTIAKAETSTQVYVEDQFSAGEWISPPADLFGLEKMVTESSILPQCIRAYKNNIAGFGIGFRYVDDVEETPEMQHEIKTASEVVELLNVEEDTKEVFEDLIEAREKYGIAYLEVIRDLSGNVQQIEFIRDVPSVRMTIPLDPYQEISYFHHGMELKRKRKFRKYKQTVGGKTVYYKEFGDPRVMDNRNGEYVSDGLEVQYQANEIMEFKNGTKPYGEVRWIGQILGVDGSRRAEYLNNNYFVNGRHTPLLIMVEGGTLTDESFDKLQQYMNDIKGEAGQHAFLVLETENAEQRTGFDDEDKPKITVQNLASILQKDELFHEYLENNRRRVQSAFQLPDLYVGYTTDFNRATAQMAMEVTEEQVFQPERKSLAWAINHRLLNDYKFKYVEVYFKEPDLTNPDDIYKLMSVANNAGGITPNDARQILYNQLGMKSQDFDGDWAEVPVSVANKGSLDAGMTNLLSQVNGQVEKAQQNHEPDEVVAVMKEVRKVLTQIQKQEGKANED